MKRFFPCAALMALFALALHADPLHLLANGAYWHHESNLVFPVTLAEFTRVGAPQEVDGTTRVIAYYAHGAGDGRAVVSIEVFPILDASLVSAPSAAFVRVIDHAGWRVTVRAPLSGEASRAVLDALVGALAVERLGAVDERCPNAGCGT